VRGWLVREYRCRGCGTRCLTAQTRERVVSYDQMKELVQGRMPQPPKGILSSYSSVKTTDDATEGDASP
jgi:hypothetical protein